MDENKEVDWDKVNRGKVRYGFALELYKKGEMLSPSKIGKIEAFVQYVMDGVEESSPQERPVVKKPIMDKEECKEILKTEEEGTAKFVKAMVHLDAEGLKQEDLDRVLKSLADGKITIDNLQRSLDKIQEIKKAYK